MTTIHTGASYAKPDSAHDKLQDDFARNLIEYNRGPSIQVYKEAILENGRRADIAKLIYPWEVMDIYEIKARREDYQNEMRTGKWEEYLGECRELVFVTPHDLVGPHEIPEGAGWITQGPRGGFRRRKWGHQDPTFKVSRRQLQIFLQRVYDHGR